MIRCSYINNKKKKCKRPVIIHNMQNLENINIKECFCNNHIPKGYDESDQELICSICLDTITPQINNNKISLDIKVLDCNHAYHKECLGPWFRENSNCPTCKKNTKKII